MKKIYLGNTLIHDEKEYNEMKESINTLKTNLEGVSAPVIYTGSITENPNGFKVYNSYGDTPLSGNLKNLRPGDKLQLFQLSDSGEELSADTYTILSGSDNYLTGNEDIRAILMLDNFNNLCEIRTNKHIAKTSSEVWLFTSSDGKLVPQNPVNSAGVTSLSFNEVKPGDVFKLSDLYYYYILSYGLGYYSTTNTPSKAVVAIENNGKLVQIYTDGSITPIDAETLNGYKASENSIPNTIPVRDDHNSLAINHITRNIEHFNFTTAGWYRIYIANNGTNISQSIRITINSGFAYTSNSSYTFEINIGWDNTVINQYASIAEYNVVDKIRVSTGNQANTYIDIHYSVSTVNDLYFSIDGLGTLQLIQNPEVPSDYRTTEFTTVNGFKSQINNTEVSYNKTINGSIKVSEGGNSSMTTEQFLTRLAELGGFENSKHITFICSHSYTNNDYIASPVGNISLSGAIINIYCNNWNPNITSGWAMYDIVIMTASVSNNINAYDNNIFVLRKVGTNPYIWKRLVNSDELPLKGSTNNFTAWTAIPCETKIYSGGFQTDVTINCSKAMSVGESVTLIMLNNTSSSHTINLTNFNVRNVDTITVEANKRAEINIMALNTNISDYHVRGVNYED